MKIIDAQIHIWSQTVVLTSGLHRKVEKFTAEEVLREMDEAGVDAALIHPPAGWDPNANAVAIEAVKKHPGRFAIMGNFPLQNPDNRKLIHGWRNQPGMMGLRWPLLLEEHQKWLHDGSLDWLWPAAEQEGLPIAMMGGLFLKKFHEIAERHPRLKMIVDHCGLNRHGRDAEAFIHLDELVAMAKLPNVAIKATENAREDVLAHVVRTYFGDSPEQAVTALLRMSDVDLSEAEIKRLRNSIRRARQSGR